MTVKELTEMTDEEFYRAEKDAEAEFRSFKKAMKKKFPHLYRVIRSHEKENKEGESLMCDLFCSKFAYEVTG